MIDYNKAWLTLELTNHCNLRCPVCSQFVAEKKDKGFLDFGDFKKLIDGMVESRIKMSNLNPFFRGESLLHPRFADMLDYIYEKSKQFPVFDFIVLHTNAEFLTPRNSDAILQMSNQKVLKHPGDIFLSIDAATKETYNLVRPGGNFEKVVSNIKHFLKSREEHRQFGPSIVFQFIVQKQNKHEAKLFLNYWSNHFKEIGIPFWVDKSSGPEIGEVKQTTIYFRRLQTTFEELENNRKMHLDVLMELGL